MADNRILGKNIFKKIKYSKQAINQWAKNKKKTQQRWRNIRRKTGEQEQKRAEVKVRILVKEGWAEEMMKRCLQQFLSIYL